MTSLSLTREGLQAEMDEWAAKVESASGWSAAKAAANECAMIAAKARRAGFDIKNQHPIKKGGGAMKIKPTTVSHDEIKEVMDASYKQARFDLASKLKPMTLQRRRDYLRKMVRNGTAIIERHGNVKTVCSIFGRTATSTSGHVDWTPAFAVENWIKACLDKDAPEGDV